ncbi:MAG: hypothetical protein U0X20_30540, partial [Caldilineaceae bacterium]
AAAGDQVASQVCDFGLYAVHYEARQQSLSGIAFVCTHACPNFNTRHCRDCDAIAAADLAQKLDRGLMATQLPQDGTGID